MLLSVLLGDDSMWLPTPLLLSTTALFGIADGTARTALSRMSSTGEVEATNGGYRISAPNLLERRARQVAGRSGRIAAWDGTWRQVIVGIGEPRSAAQRAALRATLTAARFAELREGVWLRPANLTSGETDLGPTDDVLITTIASMELDPRRLAATLWGLEAWTVAAHELIEAMAPLTDRLADGDDTALADGFVINAAVLRHLASDPLLPTELLADDWPGVQLRADFDRFDAAFRHVISAHFERHRSR